MAEETQPTTAAEVPVAESAAETKPEEEAKKAAEEQPQASETKATPAEEEKKPTEEVTLEAAAGEKKPSEEATEEAAAEAVAEEIGVTKFKSFKEESNVVADLEDPEKKALDELKQLIQAALANREFTLPPPPPPPVAVEVTSAKEEVETEEVKAEEAAKTEEAKTEEAAKEGEVKTKEVQVEEVKTEEKTTTEELKPEEAAKAEESKPAEVKAEEVKPEEVKAEEMKPEVVAKAVEVKPEVAAKALEVKPEEVVKTEEVAKAEEVKPEEAKTEGASVSAEKVADVVGPSKVEETAPPAAEMIEEKGVVVEEGTKTVEAIEETVVPVTSAPAAETEVIPVEKEPAPAAEVTPMEPPEEVFIWGVPLLGDEKSDTVLLKFLRARDFKVKEALAMIKNAVIWRKKFGIDKLLEEDLGIPELEKAVFYHGFDKEGHPVCYNVYGEFQNKDLYAKAFGDEEKTEKFLRWRIQYLEKGIRQQLDFSPGGICSMVQVTDLKNTPGPGKKELRIATRKALTLLQDNYPEFVAKQVFFLSYIFN